MSSAWLCVLKETNDTVHTMVLSAVAMTIEYTVTTSINGQQLYITTCILSVMANWQSSSVGKFCHGHAVYSNDLVTLCGSLQLRLYSSLTLTWAYREWSSITDANLTVGRTPDGEGNQSNVDHKCHCHHSVNNTDNSTWHQRVYMVRQKNNFSQTLFNT